MAPVFCHKDTCSQHGICVNKIDHAECICDEGWRGRWCSLNISQIFGLAKDLGNATDNLPRQTIEEMREIEPQAAFQSQRLRFVAVAAGASFYARNPYRFHLDPYYGCRFYYWLVNTAYAIVRIVFKKRLPPCYIVPFVVVALAISTNWASVCQPWSCIGSFAQETFALQLWLVALNGGLMLISIAATESAYLTAKNYADAEIRRCVYFLANHPYELSSRMLCVERNFYFIPIGAIVHFGCWVSVILATEYQNTAVTVIAVTFLVAYSIFIIAQLIFTRGELHKYVTIIAMMFLPKSLAPEFEFYDMLTRDEVLAKWKPSRYLKEKQDNEKAEQLERNELVRQIQHQNAELSKKYANLPSILLFNIPDEGPPVRFPSEFPLSPMDDEYIPEWQRMMFQNDWTNTYMNCRRDGMNVDDAIMTTKKVIIDQDDYLMNLTPGGLLLWTGWMNRMRAEDTFSKELLENRKIRNPFDSLPDTNKSDNPVNEEANRLHVLNGETIRERIVKAPSVRLKMQIRAMSEIWQETMKQRNAPFDAVYADDPIVAHLIETSDKETVYDILNVQEAEIERPKFAESQRPISLNPRRRPLDEFWLDPDMPGFVGPHDLSSFDNPVFDPDLRARRFFNKILDRQWKTACEQNTEFELAMLHLRNSGDVHCRDCCFFTVYGVDCYFKCACATWA
ncbi:unnamed protein product [Anisakis simplex]|uniref:EGF-like domain-containing protein n=1 Tax=Anisakis simplex TaxID=6269 RepID=A0A0M3K2W9_ANISI|nr:unnamed protein product [Anisakis simplex]